VARTAEELRQVRNAYEAALRRDPEERGEFLDRACEGRAWLRADVEALLAARGDQTSPGNAPPAERSSLVGQTIGSYIIRQEIGRGGMGVVYLADDIRLSRRVALKALAAGLTRMADGRERLRREARAAAALSHPGIATVYALEEIGGELYLACEYVPGRSLRAVLQSGPVPIDAVVDIGGQLARAMAAAHAHGIVHRDLKPENVVRTPAGVVKILDFGLARMEGSALTPLTQTGFIVGTPAYMAPE
jgi:serine/threonine-protein kinase